MRLCAVCGSPGAAFHYQGLTCQSCRVFFVRTIRRGRYDICRNGNEKCEINFSSRSYCAFCRFKKCLKHNMQISEVGKHCSSIRRAVVRFFKEKDYVVKLIKSNFDPAGLYLLSTAFGDNIYVFLQHMILFEKRIMNLDGPTPSKEEIQPDVSLFDLLSNPGKCASRSTAAWCTRLCKKVSKDYSLINLFTRFYVYLADFLSALVEFQQLCTDDKVKLSQYHFGHLAYLDFAWNKWKHGLETINCPGNFDKYKMTEEEHYYWKARCTSAAIYEEAVIEIFSSIIPSHEEIMLFKLSMIFNPPENLSENGKQICRSARGKYQNMLGTYIAQKYPELTKSQQLYRFSRLLECFSFFKILSEDSGQRYVIMIQKNIGGLRQQLTHDIRVKIFL